MCSSDLLDADGEAILKTGEMITGDLLEHARAEAVLSELSVAVRETPAEIRKTS